MINFTFENPEAVNFIERFLCSDNKAPKYIFGTNHHAYEIASQVSVDGYIDDLNDDSDFNGLPIIRSSEVPSNAMVVIVALMRPITLHKKLEILGIEHLHSIAFLRFSKLKLTAPWFWDGFENDFYKNRSFYEGFDQYLADHESISIFENIINFRLTGDLVFLKSFSDRQFEQYFEPFLKLKKGDVFVDVGGFDGQTASAFASRCPRYSEIHLFEPEKKNISTARNVCHSLRDVYFHEVGLSDAKITLGILVGGSTSKVVSQGEGDYDIKLDTLDVQMFGKKVSFIKMDIEGGELKALIGSREIIKINKPNLAICVYHKGYDIRVIYEYVIAINPHYKVYLRHYTEGILETVLFFVFK